MFLIQLTRHEIWRSLWSTVNWGLRSYFLRYHTKDTVYVEAEPNPRTPFASFISTAVVKAILLRLRISKINFEFL